MSRVALDLLVVAVVVTGSILPADPAPAQPAPSVEVRCENAGLGIPEFGGAYLEDRVLHVWITEPDTDVTDAILTALRERCPEHGVVVIRAADYPYTQLSDWGRRSLALPEVKMTSVDVRTNRLTVGVTDVDHDAAAVMAALAEIGVPAEVVVLEGAGPFRTLPIGPDNSRLVWLAGALALVAVISGAAALMRAHRRRRRAARP
jgi:hypothetical protein